MNNIFKSYKISQRFFIEKLLDLYYQNVLDTYRVKVHNPKSILQETCKLINDWQNNKIKKYDTLIENFQELLDLSTIDNQLDYGFIKKEYIVSLIQANQQETNLNELKYSIQYLLSKNENYLEKLITAIDEEANKDYADLSSKDSIAHFDNLSRLTGFFATELINIGYSKIFLYKLISKTFIKTQKKREFQEGWSFVKGILLEKKEKEYWVIFRFVKSKGLYQDYLYTKIPDDISPQLNQINKIKHFIQEKPPIRFRTFEVKALDFYQAVRKAKEDLSLLLDTIHLAFDDVISSINENVLVVEKGNINNANIQPLSFFIDGKYLKDNDRYTSLKETIERIDTNTYIQINVKEKIKSAIRYLRIGNEALELEQKYMTYWIAIEQIFSVNQRDISTFHRMYENFPKIQLICYVKRNLQYLHNEIGKNYTLSLNDDFPFYNDDLQYFLDENNIDIIIEKFTTTPLLSYKVNKMKSALHHTDKIKKYLKNHEKNIQRHLFRLYRIRNEIMHEAALIPNIENLTGNLKYYLIFTLNLLLDYFSHNNLDFKRNLNLDDFFQHQNMLYYSVKSDISKEKLLRDYPYFCVNRKL